MPFASGFSSGFSSGFGSRPSISIEMDFDRDDDFDEAFEDITSYVVSGADFRGKDDPGNLKGVAVAGTLTLNLLNLDGAWSKFNTNSPFYGMLKPGVKIRVKANAPTSGLLWSGYLDRVEPHVTNGGLPRATLYGLGVLADFVGEEAIINPPALNGEYTGDVVNQILDTFGHPTADRDIDTGTVPVGRWFPGEEQTLNLIREMEEQEGGDFSEGLEWDVKFRDRYDRLLNHATSVATFTDDGSGALGYREIEQSDPLKNVFNKFEVTITPYTLGDSTTLWTLTDVITLAPGERRTYFVQMPTDIDGVKVAYIDTWQSIEITRDGTVVNSFAISSGVEEALSDVAVTSTAFATALKIEIENIDASSHTVDGLTVDGLPVFAGNAYKVTDEDMDSIDDFGPRRFPFDSRWFLNTAYADASMAFELARHKDEHPIIPITIVGSDDVLFEQCVVRDLSDRVTIEAESTQTQLGISQDFFIESISHSYGAGRLLATSFTASPVIDVYDGADPFIMGSSDLGGIDVLAF